MRRVVAALLLAVAALVALLALSSAFRGGGPGGPAAALQGAEGRAASAARYDVYAYLRDERSGIGIAGRGSLHYLELENGDVVVAGALSLLYRYVVALWISGDSATLYRWPEGLPLQGVIRTTYYSDGVVCQEGSLGLVDYRPQYHRCDRALRSVDLRRPDVPLLLVLGGFLLDSPLAANWSRYGEAETPYGRAAVYAAEVGGTRFVKWQAVDGRIYRLTAYGRGLNITLVLAGSDVADISRALVASCPVPRQEELTRPAPRLPSPPPPPPGRVYRYVGVTLYGVPISMYYYREESGTWMAINTTAPFPMRLAALFAPDRIVVYSYNPLFEKWGIIYRNGTICIACSGYGCKPGCRTENIELPDVHRPEEALVALELLAEGYNRVPGREFSGSISPIYSSWWDMGETASGRQYRINYTTALDSYIMLSTRLPDGTPRCIWWHAPLTVGHVYVLAGTTDFRSVAEFQKLLQVR